MGQRARSTLLPVVFALAAALSPAAGQTHRDTRLGFQFKPPKDFRTVALNPTETLVVAKYQDDNREYGVKGTVARNNLFQVYFFPADKEASAGEPFEAVLEKLEKRLGYFEIEKRKTTKIRKAPCLELTTLEQQQGVEIRAYYVIIQHDDGTFVMRGDAFENRYSKSKGKFSKAARSFKRIEKEDAALREAELSQLDDQERFLREQIDKLPAGWDSLRTQRYLFLFNAEASFVKQMAEQIEALRNEYERLYPPKKPIEAVSIVRVCNSRDEYFGYGGPPGTGGYWSSGHKELVFFDNPPRSETLAVLNHEAFHQYIYYFYGELAPHSWYNEGHGDYFSGARMTRTYRITGYKNAPGGFDRSGLVKDMVRLARQGKAPKDGAMAPLKDLMKFSQPEYYSSSTKRPVGYYPQGWALVHMLREHKRLKPKWERILPDYLDNLLAAREEVAKTLMDKLIANAEKIKEGSSKKMSKEAKEYYDRVDGGKVQDRAYELTFADWSDKDWKGFEKAFMNYAEKL